jgi:hypothetical protein
MKKWVIALVVIALAAAFVNDIGRFLTASYSLKNSTRAVGQAAAEAARRSPGNVYSGWPAAASAAQAAGIQVTGYAQEEQIVVVVATAPVTGTWVVGPIRALSGGRPWNTPFFASSRSETYYR